MKVLTAAAKPNSEVGNVPTTRMSPQIDASDMAMQSAVAMVQIVFDFMMLSGISTQGAGGLGMRLYAKIAG